MSRHSHVYHLIKTLLCSIVVTLITTSTAHATTSYVRVAEIPVSAGVSQMVWSPLYSKIIVRNGNSTLRVIDTTTGSETGTLYPHGNFTDLNLSPDGRYVYVADFGGEIYEEPIDPSYVGVYDLQNDTWLSFKVSGVAYTIEAMSSNSFLLLSSGQWSQWVTLTANTWNTGGVTCNGTITARSTGTNRLDWFHGGDIEYDPKTGRIFHNESVVYKWNGSAFVSQEGPITCGNDYSSTAILSTDGRSYYNCGKLQVDALDITSTKHIFPESIYAANANYAIGNGKYYDATSGDLIGNLGITTTIFALDKGSNDFWAFDASSLKLLRYTNSQSTIDTDNDGIADSIDNCPAIANQDQLDTNGDQMGDACDTSAPSSSIKSYVQVAEITVSSNVSQIVWSPSYNKIIARNANSSLRLIDTTTGNETGTFYPHGSFTDLSLSPDGRYVYVADFGGDYYAETPISPSYVGIYDLQKGTWVSYEVSDVAYRIEAISSSSFLLLSSDQFVSLTGNSWGTGGVTRTSEYWCCDLYQGDIAYDYNTGRMIHGNSGLSSQEIYAIKWIGSKIVFQEDSGCYGTSQGYGGTTVLSTDGRSYYYGKLQVDALNVAFNKRIFPELIYAANSKYAFGNGKYYDAASGDLAGNLGVTSTIFALDKGSNDFWAFDASSHKLLRYTDDHSAIVDIDSNGIADSLDNRPVLAGPSAVSYFPLETGMEWTYAKNDSYGSVTLTVMPGTEYVNGVAVKKVVIQGGEFSGAAQFCSNDASGVMLHKIYYPSVYISGYGYTTMTVTLSPPYKMFNPVVAIGDSIQSNGSLIYEAAGVGSYTLNYERTSTILAEEEVEVSAGSFTAIKTAQTSLKYGTTRSGRYVSDESSETVWYAANLGEVKTDSSDGEVSHLSATNILSGFASPAVKANGSAGPLVVSPGEEIRISVSLDPSDGTGKLASWWLVADSPYGWYSYVPPGIWQPGITPYVGTAPLLSLNSFDLFQMPFPAGKTILHFAIKGYREWVDSLEVNVSPAAAHPSAH